MKDLAIHEPHYNREPIPSPFTMIRLSTPNLTAMLLIAAACVATLAGLLVKDAAVAQAPLTETPQPGAGQAYITNTFTGEPAINVRTGPSTIVYPDPCGSMPLGATAAALGASPGHDWVQIAFPSCPGGVGWVYAANVTLTGSLRVVEPPPTPAPLATATIDPTLQAAFQAEPTETRLPTFTPPPPLSIPTFAQDVSQRGGLPFGTAILVVALVGGLGLAASFLSRR
jgi:uncharacterized protein YraI